MTLTSICDLSKRLRLSLIIALWLLMFPSTFLLLKLSFPEYIPTEFNRQQTSSKINNSIQNKTSFYESLIRQEADDESKVVKNWSFSLKAAAKLWDERVGCKAFREKHADLINNYSFVRNNKWAKSRSFQDWNDPPCKDMKQQHVIIEMKAPDWFSPNWMDGIHTCERCGITCHIFWRTPMAIKPDAQVFVDTKVSPIVRRRGFPLRVYFSMEGLFINKKQHADIGVGFPPHSDVQVTYAVSRTRNHFLSPTKRQDSIVYYASSDCDSEMRNKLASQILPHVAHHSFGSCMNNMGGSGRELHLYPYCKCRSNPWENPRQKVDHCAMSHYKFVLAIERVSQPGYVTEKMFIPLEAGVVPIYKGAPDVDEFVPPDSFIPLDKFNSSISLLQYVRKVNRDPVLYMNYFAWKRCGVLGPYAKARAFSRDSFPCRLCERISAMGGREYQSGF